jgi:NAD-dependent SIR2 family protein deacetylase
MAHEYEEEPYVLRQKISLLCSLLTESRSCVVYSGAGISTSTGIPDYATKSEHDGSVRRPKLRSNLDAQPSIAHRAIVEMHKAGIVKYWGKI